MAGIGFELKKVFAKKGFLNSIKGYGYAAVVSTGPMLLGILLLLGIMGLCMLMDVDIHLRELFISMITYTMLASTLVTAVFSQVVTRFIADMLFAEDHEAILPAFWGSISVTLALGSLIYGSYLIISGASFLQGFLCYMLLGELIIVWNAMNFLSALKDYKSIFLSFFAGIAISLST